MIPVSYYLVIAAFLFGISLAGMILNRKILSYCSCVLS